MTNPRSNRGGDFRVTPIDAGQIGVEWTLLKGQTRTPQPSVICGARHPFSRKLGARQQDVVRVALAVYSADRLLQRSTTWSHHAKGWHRELSLQIPVVDLATWTAAHDQVTRLLEWMTEDTWSIEFVTMPWSGGPDQVHFPVRYDGVALFSGGLDSLAGYVAAHRAGSDPIAFGIATHRRTASLQKRVMKAACTMMKVPLRPVARVPLRVPQRDNFTEHHHFEASQRTRGFLYLSLAAVMADIVSTPTIWVYENGVGAINLPLLSTQMGAMSSRSVHPRTILQIQQVLRSVLSSDLRVELPYVFSTKGQVVESLTAFGLSKLAHVTVSCDSFPRQDKPCGKCTSCLLTRMSLAENDDANRYEETIWARSSLAQVAMESHMSQLVRALSSHDRWEALTQEFPELWHAVDGITQLTGLAESVVCQRLIAMYERWVSEWQAYVALSAAARK